MEKYLLLCPIKDNNRAVNDRSLKGLDLCLELSGYERTEGCGPSRLGAIERGDLNAAVLERTDVVGATLLAFVVVVHCRDHCSTDVLLC